MVSHGSIITTGDLPFPLLVISKDLYNSTGFVIACPIMKKKRKVPFEYYIETPRVKGFVLIDNPRQLNLNSRGCFIKSEISMGELIMVLDIYHSLFDYV